MNHYNYFKNYLTKKDNQSFLSNPNVGYVRGNMFNNLYKPYRNYSVNEYLPKNEKERLMYEIQKHTFVLNDLVLYLDVNPNDQKVLDKFNEYKDAYNRLVNEYERKYNPLTVNSNELDTTPWKWLNNWPKGEVK